MFAVLAAIVLGPMIYRMGSPIPPDDITAITLFLRNRSETAISIRRLVVGGPWDRQNRRPIQRGRPYEVLAEDAGGARRLHRLAADGRDSQGAVALKRREGGAWVEV